jgi:hypothetical protein
MRLSTAQATPPVPPRSEEPSAPILPPPPPATVVVTGPTRLSDADRDALRGLIREELRAARVTADAGGASPEPEATDRAVSNQDVKAYDQARATVDEAIARGSWTEADRAQLRVQLASLPTPMREELLGPLFVSINTHKVRFDGHGPPL